MTWRNAIRCLFPVVMFCFYLAARVAIGQVTTGDIVGTAQDTSGAVIPNAKVTVENTATHQMRVLTTSATGDYSSTLLQPGPYTITMEATGFKTFRTANLDLHAGDRTRVDGKLEIGQTSETVEVTANAAVLQTDSAALSTSVTEKAVQDLPLNGRNYVTLVQTTPGANAGSPNSIASGQRPDERRPSNSVSANGQAEMSNNNMVDGFDNNELEQGLIIIRPSIDSIQEIKVVTNSFSAEIGRSPGAAVNVITKSGTNAFHGTLFEYFGHDKLNANDYFAKQTIFTKAPKYRFHQFGGSFGGPIFKDKTFFFVDAEALRVTQGVPTGLLTIPTVFELNNPGNLTDRGGPIVSVDPIALQYLALYPSPNVGGSTQLTNNYFNVPIRTQKQDDYDGRIDHHFGPNDSIWARYNYNPVTTFTPGPFPEKDGIQPGSGTGGYPGLATETAQGGAVNYVHIFTPNLLIELKAGYSRINLFSAPLNYGTFAADKIGMPNVNNYDRFNTGLAPVSIGGFTGLGDATAIPISDVNNVFQYAGSVTYTHGPHTFKAGTGFIRRQLNYYQAVTGQGSFTFSSSNSSQAASNPLASLGVTPTQNLALFLTGQTTALSRQNQASVNYMRTTEPHIYAQDDWRVTKSLTMNVGVRWDYYSPITEARNLRSNFDIDTLKLIVASDGNRTAGVRPDWSNWQPRIGFSQMLPGNTVIRGGFGMTYYNPFTGAAALNLQNPPIYPQAFNCQQYSTNAALQCPAGIGTLHAGPPVPQAGSLTNLAGTVYGIPKGTRNSYVYQFNTALQKQAGSNSFTISYVGLLGRHQEVNANLNLPSPCGCTTAPQFQYQQQLPNVQTINWRTPSGSSSYHALQGVYEHRVKYGLTVNSSYTYASNLNNFADTSGSISLTQQVRNNYAYDHGNSDIAIRHHFVLMVNYALPFFNHSSNGFAKAALGGWQVNTLSYYQTGLPFMVRSSLGNIKLPGVTTDRPDRVPGASLEGPKTLAQWFNVNAFQPNPIGTPGNGGRNNLWGPNTRQIDFSVFKSWMFFERVNLQFRAAAFNLTNTANFDQPNGTIASFGTNNLPNLTGNTFGRITSTRLGMNPRQLQFALHASF